ncbi:PilZ domain-containing protein [Ectothiorhodospira magna]|uniref:PilZ domain-containing protein n=1 Tax=Ectothiorhodospira magna TaxID=867345 RepID=A0A1H9AH71_9GAMM|nr:PilZ domain-containing protein [Ectothiorhodospira magna]SEP75827.1 PilZ domain-containing protein [Ectothiorhodospira magna]
MGQDQRRHPRVPLEVMVELYRTGASPRRVPVLDLSGGGALLLIPKGDLPNPGEQVKMRLCDALGDGELPPMVSARVVRCLPHGVAVEFLVSKDEGCRPGGQQNDDSSRHIARDRAGSGFPRPD